MAGEPLNVCQPSDDAYDWGKCYDWNFSVIRSTLNALAKNGNFTFGVTAATVTATGRITASDLYLYGGPGGLGNVCLGCAPGFTPNSTGGFNSYFNFNIFGDELSNAINIAGRAQAIEGTDLSGTGLSQGTLQLWANGDDESATETISSTKSATGFNPQGVATNPQAVTWGSTNHIEWGHIDRLGLHLVYGVSAASATLSGGLTASSATLTASGNTQYSVQTSSGINVQAGMVVSPGGFNGPLYGNASTASALQSAPTTAGSGFVSGGINVSGNARLIVVDASAVSGSTNPVQSGGEYTQFAAKASTGTNTDITALNNLGVSNSSPTFAQVNASSSVIVAFGGYSSSTVFFAPPSVTTCDDNAGYMFLDGNKVGKTGVQTDATNSQALRGCYHGTQVWVANATQLAAGGLATGHAAMINPVMSFTAPGFIGVGDGKTGFGIVNTTAAVTLNVNGVATPEIYFSPNGIVAVAQSTITVLATDINGVGLNVAGGIKASSITVSSGSFTATGNTQYAVALSTSLTFTQGVTGIGVRWADGTVSTTAATGGGGSGGGHVYSTATISGTSVVSDSTLFKPTARSSATFDTAGFQLIDDPTHDATIIQVKNLTFVAHGTWNPSGSTSQTSLGVCQFNNSSFTWTQGNNVTNFDYSGTVSADASRNAFVGLLLDGVLVSSNTGNANTLEALNMHYQTPTALSSGSHTACLSFAVNTGTLAVGTGAATGQSQGTVTELGTGGAGYSVPITSEAPSSVPSFTFSGKTSFQSVTNVASTTTITGSVVDVQVTCGWSRTGGAFGNSLFGQISRDNGAETFSLPTIGAGTSGQSTNITGNDNGRHLFTGLSAGTHVFQLQVETSDAGAESWATAGQCKILALEIKNTAGSGDASTNGNNTFSGSNTVSGPWRLNNRTIAQLQAIVPQGTGEEYYCSNCSPAKAVTSTGTNAGNFADMVGGTFK